METFLNYPVGRTLDNFPLEVEDSKIEFSLNPYDFPLSLTFYINLEDPTLSFEATYALHRSGGDMNEFEIDGVHINMDHRNRLVIGARLSPPTLSADDLPFHMNTISSALLKNSNQADDLVPRANSHVIAKIVQRVAFGVARRLSDLVMANDETSDDSP